MNLGFLDVMIERDLRSLVDMVSREKRMTKFKEQAINTVIAIVPLAILLAIGFVGGLPKDALVGGAVSGFAGLIGAHILLARRDRKLQKQLRELNPPIDVTNTDMRTFVPHGQRAMPK